MNRISNCELSQGTSLVQDMETFERTSTQSSTRSTNSYHIVAPLHYEKNYAYPLIVWLHENGGSEYEIQQVMLQISMQNYVGVGVRGPIHVPNTRSFQWDEIVGGILKFHELVIASMEAASRRYNIARHRIFLAGFGAGAQVAMRLALNAPQLFGGVISMGAGLPKGNTPLRHIQHARRLKMLVCYGRESQRYPEDDVCNDLRLVHTAGLKLHLRQYPCGDIATTEMFKDADAWIMDVVTNGASSQSSSTEHVSASQWN